MGKQKHHQEFQVQGKGSRKGKDKENKPTDMEQLFLISAPPLRSACWSL